MQQDHPREKMVSKKNFALPAVFLRIIKELTIKRKRMLRAEENKMEIHVAAFSVTSTPDVLVILGTVYVVGVLENF